MNSNPQAVAFTNTQARPAADRLAQLYYSCKELVNNWNIQSVAVVIPPGDQTIIADGAQTDGRAQVTNDNIYGVILQAQAFITSMEANSSANLTAVLKAAVNVNP